MGAMANEQNDNLEQIFGEALKALDYGTVVVLLRKYLPAGFWGNMTIRQQVLVYTAALIAGCDELAKMMFNKLARTPAEFTTWQEIYNWILPSSDLLRPLAQTRMIETATSAEHWQVIYLLAQPNTDIKALAPEKISALTPEHKGGY